VRWLLLKDVQILRRSPLLVTLLVVYPILIALLIGFALSRGPEKPRVAFLNEVPASQSKINLGGRTIDVTKYTGQLFQAIKADPRALACRGAGQGEVRRCAGALIIPPDVTQKLASGLQPPRWRWSTTTRTRSRPASWTRRSPRAWRRPNTALADTFKDIAAQDIKLLLDGAAARKRLTPARDEAAGRVLLPPSARHARAQGRDRHELSDTVTDHGDANASSGTRFP